MFVPGVNFQDGFAANEVGRVNDDLAVETAGPQQRAVQDFGPVGGGEENDAGVGLETVHFDEQRVERLLAFVVYSANMDAALAPDGVQLVNENDARGVLLGLLEEVAHSRRAHADEHLDEVAAADGEERRFGFTGHGAGQEGLAGAGRSDEQHAFGDARAQLPVSLRIFEEVHHFLQLEFGLVATGHVVEGDSGVFVHDESGATLADAQDGFAGGAEAAADESPQAHHNGDGQ